jgi:hypothetical protein
MHAPFHSHAGTYKSHRNEEPSGNLLAPGEGLSDDTEKNTGKYHTKNYNTI